MTKPLAGRVALVTGSAKRLGRTIAAAIAAQGATVAIHYRNSREEAEAVAEALGGAAFQADVTDPVACEALVAAVVARFGRLDVLVNNVGDWQGGSVLSHDPAVWRATLANNLDSVFYMCHHAVPHLRQSDRGRVVNLGLAGSGNVVARPSYTAYAIAKQGALALTKSLAVALGDTPITVNMVSPGTLEGSVSTPPLATVPKGRWAREEEIAATVCSFLSPQADYITGQHLEVAGGWAL